MDSSNHILLALLEIVLLTTLSFAIYTPEDQNQKPITYTTGIKTVTYTKYTPRIQFHHNYSKVSHQNSLLDSNYETNSENQESSTERPFPIYNAHTYGVTPSRNEKIIKVYIVNNTRTSKTENPDKPITIYKRRRHSAKIEVYHTCPAEITGQFVYDLSCNQFLNCWKGRGYVQNCAPGTLFNPKTLECDFAQKVECITGPRHNSLGFQRSSKIVEQVGCPKEFSGIIPNYSDCSKFINCANGIEHNMDCPPGTLFDVTKNICDFAYKAQCFNGQQQNADGRVDFDSSVSGRLDFENSGGHGGKSNYQSSSGKYQELHVQGGNSASSNSYGQYGHGQIETNHDLSSGQYYGGGSSSTSGQIRGNYQASGQQTVDQYGSSTYGSSSSVYGQHNFGAANTNSHTVTQSKQPVCPKDAVGIQKHPTDCSKFLNCANGQTFIQDCAPGTLFNPNIGNCDFPHNVKCDNEQTEANTEVYHNVRYDKTVDGQHSYGQHQGQDSNTGLYDSSIGSQQGQGQYHRTGQFGQGTNTNCQGSQTGCKPIAGTRTQYDHGQGSNCQGSQTGCNPRPPGQYDQSTGQGTGNQYPQVQSPDCQGSQTGCNPRPQGNFGHGTNQYPGQYDQSTGHQGTGNQYPQGQSPNCQGSQTGCNPRPQGNSGHGTNQYPPGSRCQEGQTDCNPSSQGQGWNQHGSSVNGNHQYQQGQFSQSGSQSQYQHNQGQVGPQQKCEPGQDNCNTGHLINKGSGSNHNMFDWTRNPTQFQNQNNQQSQTQWSQSGTDLEETQTVSANYDQVVNINNHLPQTSTSRPPFRKPYEPFFGLTTRRPRINPNQQVETFPSQSQAQDYEDIYSGGQSVKYVAATTPRVIVEKIWPPPFPSTDVNADYVFEYEDGEEITLEAENSISKDNDKKIKRGNCEKNDFHCSTNKCLSKTFVCNGIKDCPDGSDELNCDQYTGQFTVNKNYKLAVLEKERWDNVTISTCALLCVENQKFKCKSFNYRKIDKTCFLTDTNIALSGALIAYYPCDYYERTSEKMDCTNMYRCSNKKCIEHSQLCDGQDDCGDRMDEKGCDPKKFGYSISLTGSKKKHEGQIEVTAFGKTGYICDDQFGLRDANIACKELGFVLGATEVKGNSFFAKNKNVNNTFYMMDDVSCSGNETKLMDCDFSGWGVHNCLGQEIAGVVCKTPQEKCPKEYWQCDTGQECLPLAFVCDGLLDCTDESDEASQHCDAPTDIRLVNGTKRQEGRLEIRHNGIWGTVCDDDFNEDAAKVVCKYLGFKGSAVAKKEGYFGPGSGPIWLDQVFCSGNETSIETCTHWNWGEHNCDHNEDVGVICSNVLEIERHSSVVSVQPPTLSEIYPRKCGYRKDNIFNVQDDVHFRVVKGSVAQRGDYPWQAAIRVKGKTKAAHWCGAVIISEKFVLTAAHCLIGYSKGAYIIVAGDYNVDEDEGTEQEAFIDDYYIHEKFREGHKMNNDIALIKLKGRGFSFSQDVQPICLPHEDTNYGKDLNCTISGFGSIESGTSGFSHDLRAGWVPVQAKEICTMPHVYGEAITDGMICAGSLDEGIDACEGDSGGPLACLKDGLFTLYGITSWGQHCGYANKPGVYVKVAHYKTWIDDTINKYAS